MQYPFQYQNVTSTSNVSKSHTLMINGNDGLSYLAWDADLLSLFVYLNHKRFDGKLPLPDVLRFASPQFLKCLVGREVHGLFGVRDGISQIFISDDTDTLLRIYSTMIHEMCHYKLWLDGVDAGHGIEFWRLYNQVNPPQIIESFPSKNPRWYHGFSRLKAHDVEEHRGRLLIYTPAPRQRQWCRLIGFNYEHERAIVEYEDSSWEEVKLTHLRLPMKTPMFRLSTWRMGSRLASIFGNDYTRGREV